MHGRHPEAATGYARLSQGCNDAGMDFTADAGVIDALRQGRTG
jgi:hypothetical protein